MEDIIPYILTIACCYSNLSTKIMASESYYCSSTYPTNNIILRALRANSKVLSLDNSKLQSLPPALGRLISLTTFSAKNNRLDDNGLSQVLQSLEKVTVHSIIVYIITFCCISLDLLILGVITSLIFLCAYRHFII